MDTRETSLESVDYVFAYCPGYGGIRAQIDTSSSASYSGSTAYFQDNAAALLYSRGTYNTACILNFGYDPTRTSSSIMSFLDVYLSVGLRYGNKVSVTPKITAKSSGRSGYYYAVRNNGSSSVKLLVVGK